jgi:HPt (histidine-containing phosphotransfer) domain-containing protein
MGDEPEEFAAILSIYLAQISTSLQELDTAVKGENARTLELIAHSCAGSSAN